MSKVNYDQVPLTNDSGDVLNPGDEAVAVTMCTNQANLRVGKYLGTRSYKGYFGNTVSVIMSVNKTRKKLVHKETGVEYDFLNERKVNPYPSWSNDRTDYYRRVDELRMDYEWKVFPYVGRTTLQRNKIYPANKLLKNVTL